MPDADPDPGSRTPGPRPRTATQDPGPRTPTRDPRPRTQDRGPGNKAAQNADRRPWLRVPGPRPKTPAPPTLAPGPELRTLIPARKPRPRPHIPIPDLGHRTADHSPDPGPSRSPQGPRPLPARDPTRAGQEDAARRPSGGGEGGGGAAPAGDCGEGPGPGSPGRGRGCCAHLVPPDAPRRLSRLSRRSGGGRVRAAPRALRAGAPARLGPVPRRLLHSRARARSRSRSAAASVRPSDASSHRDGRGGPCPQPRETPRRVTAHVARARTARPRPRRAHARVLPPCAHPGSVRERLKGAARAVGEPATEGPQAWCAPGPALRRALCASVGLPAADPLASLPSGCGWRPQDRRGDPLDPAPASHTRIPNTCPVLPPGVQYPAPVLRTPRSAPHIRTLPGTHMCTHPTQASPRAWGCNPTHQIPEGPLPTWSASADAQPLLARDRIPASRWTGPVLGDARGGLCELGHAWAVWPREAKPKALGNGRLAREV